MSSSIFEQKPIKTKDTLSVRYNPTEISTKGPWLGYHLPQLKEMKSEQNINSSKIRPTIKTMMINMEDKRTNQEEPVEIEQLISMMRKHKVSDATASFHFNFGSAAAANDLKQSKPSVPKTTNFTLSPEFQFSFSANVRSVYDESTVNQRYKNNRIMNNQKNYIEVGDDYYADSLEDEDDDLTRKPELNNGLNTTNYNQHLINRKILPLPKPRWKRSIEKNNNNQIEEKNEIKSTTTTDLTRPILPLKKKSNLNNLVNNKNSNKIQIQFKQDSTSTDIRDNIKKLKSSNPPIVDNKRKERNWNDNCITTAEVTELTKDFFIDPKLRIPLSSNKVPSFINQDLKNWKSFVPPALLDKPTSKLSQSISTKKSPTQKNKGRTPSQEDPPKKQSFPSFSSSSTTTSGKKSTNKKKSNKKKNNHQTKDDILAPGGFLSSDITLFDNPISDDWICLFCQYDILMYGLDETKRKNGYYRRKRERNKRLKEAELRRLGGLSESEEDHEHHL